MQKPLNWTTEKRKIADLIPTETNPRKLSLEGRERLKNKLEKLGVFEIPAVDENNQLLNFNQRLKILLALGKGQELIDVRVPNRPITLSERKEIVLSSNLHEGEWDIEILESDYADIDFDAVGLEMDKLMMEFAQENDFELDTTEAEDDNFEIPEKIETDIKEGDLIQIGPHRLLCGDSTNPENWKKLMQGEQADMVLIDPPYNVDYEGKTARKLKIQNDNMDINAFNEFILAAFKAIYSVTKKGGVWYVWHSDNYGDVFRNTFKNVGLKLSQCLVWVKDNFVLGRQDYHWKHEPCLYGWKGMGHQWFSDRTQSTVLEFDKPLRNEDHPTMKPVPLIAYQIKNSSKKGGLICDGFLGSGTTIVASHQLDRRCYGMELSPEFCQVIVDRMKRLEPEIHVEIFNHNF
ncbi:DNA modification methylase [Chondrinema litorale]|uniref:DNA modification methylase n=1 Tax=Chondrinema litorale TaxID=2994555 RepID=UPI0025429684|nr:DNA modification methylase [Chondrinema litorale]UZR93148.1 DNA modification methylase [Chondrinema litorale]